MSRNSWIRTFHAKSDARARLVCFPHAGGPAMAFTALSAALPADVELLAVQYPGRQDRASEPFADDVTALAEGVVDALAAFDDRPLFLLGHSFGAIVAFETARLLRGRTAPAGLFASAAWPPSADWRAHVGGEQTDEEIVRQIRSLGGVPQVLLDDPEMVGEMIRLLRGDGAALARYRADENATVAAPLTVLVARDDPKNTVEQMANWERHTTGAYRIELLPGDHFALIQPEPAVVPLLVRSIREELRRAAGATAATQREARA